MKPIARGRALVPAGRGAESMKHNRLYDLDERFFAALKASKRPDAVAKCPDAMAYAEEAESLGEDPIDSFKHLIGIEIDFFGQKDVALQYTWRRYPKALTTDGYFEAACGIANKYIPKPGSVHRDGSIEINWV
jgi:hypothetical protein